METDRHDGHVARVAPVDAFLLRDELVGEISSGKQAAVQGDVGQPGEPFDRFFQHCSPHRGTEARRQCSQRGHVAGQLTGTLSVIRLGLVIQWR